MKSRSSLVLLILPGLLFTSGQTSLFASDDGFGIKPPVNLFEKYVLIGGKIEIEAEWSKLDNHKSESNFSFASSELDIEVQFTQWSSGTVVLEWDDEDERIIFDETFLTIGSSEIYPLIMQIGRYDLPFGAYDGNTISSPLTQEVFESKEDAVMLRVEGDTFYTSLYLFKNETPYETGNNDRAQFGGNIGYELTNNTIRFNGGIDLISSSFDKDDPEGNVFDNPDSNSIAALAAHIKFGIDRFGIFAEYISTFATDGSNNPSAWQLECTYLTEFSGRETFLSLGYSRIDDFDGLLPGSRFSATSGIKLSDEISLTLEYARDESDSINKHYTPDDNTLTNDNDINILTAQLAYRF